MACDVAVTLRAGDVARILVRAAGPTCPWSRHDHQFHAAVVEKVFEVAEHGTATADGDGDDDSSHLAPLVVDRVFLGRKVRSEIESPGQVVRRFAPERQEVGDLPPVSHLAEN